MKNFQKLAMGMLVAALAIGFSAFTGTTKTEKTTASVFYILTSSNQYQRYTGGGQPSEDGCEDIADHNCVIGFDSDQGSTIDANALPSAPTYQSSTKGLWSN
tara:strand:- start:5423 stop:5728 length:306 start_codon:yes stop_codon:yes gene_type:complete